MAISKLIFNGQTQMDVTANTADESTTLYGYEGTAADGTQYTGEIAAKTSSDVDVTGDTVTIPAGAYASQVTKTVSAGTATTPATTITANPSISVNTSTGVISASVSATQSVTPTVTAGYIDSGTAGTITVSGSNTSSLSTVNGATVSPTESEQTAVAANKYTLGAVKVGAISSTYVGSGITQRSSTDLSVSGATVTAPAGFYGSAATKSVTSGSATTPATTITPNSISISVNSSTGVITASNTQKTQSVTPTVSAGYVSSGTAGTITVSAASNTSQLSTQAAQTIYPSTTDQTISSGKYLTGTQTIKAVTTTNLTAENIKSGVTVEVGDSADSDRVASVTGTYSGGSATIATKTVTNADNTATSISFTSLSGTPKAFYLRLTSNMSRSSSYSYYYITSMRWNGTNTYGQYWRMSNGAFYGNDTSHYSFTYSNGTLTLTSSASRGAAGGSFYNGTYELVYVY